MDAVPSGSREPKSIEVAYLLWFLGGALGAHRFYLGSARVGATMAAAILIAVSVPPKVGWVLLIPIAGWTLLDALYIPGLLRARALGLEPPFFAPPALAWFAIAAAAHIGTAFLADISGASHASALSHIAGLGWALFMSALSPAARRGGAWLAFSWALAALPLHLASVAIPIFGPWIVLALHSTLCAIAAARHEPAPPPAPAAQGEPPAVSAASGALPSLAPARGSERDILAAIDSQARSLPKHAGRIREIVEIGEKILAEIERDPKSLPAVQRFLDYYLESAAKIVALHAKVAASKGGRPETGLNEALDDIHRTFQHFLDRALDDDVADLDSELAVLRTKMRSEGIS